MAAGKRSYNGGMGKLLLLFIIVPAVELGLLIQVGIYLGTWPDDRVDRLHRHRGCVSGTAARSLGFDLRSGADGPWRAPRELARGRRHDPRRGRTADGTGDPHRRIRLLAASCPGFRNLIKDILLACFCRAVEENRVHVHVSGMGFDADSGPVVDIRPESFGPDPPKYKVH